MLLVFFTKRWCCCDEFHQTPPCLANTIIVFNFTINGKSKTRGCGCWIIQLSSRFLCTKTVFVNKISQSILEPPSAILMRAKTKRMCIYIYDNNNNYNCINNNNHNRNTPQPLTLSIWIAREWWARLLIVTFTSTKCGSTALAPSLNIKDNDNYDRLIFKITIPC